MRDVQGAPDLVLRVRYRSYKLVSFLFVVVQSRDLQLGAREAAHQSQSIIDKLSLTSLERQLNPSLGPETLFWKSLTLLAWGYQYHSCGRNHRPRRRVSSLLMALWIGQLHRGEMEGEERRCLSSFCSCQSSRCRSDASARGASRDRER